MRYDADFTESRKTRRKQLAENNSSKILGGKLVEKQLAEVLHCKL